MPPRLPWPDVSRALVDCAMGRLPADLVIRGGRWVCVQSGEIVPDTEELEDCRWFTRGETLAMLERTHAAGLTTPPRMAIAHTLIRAWAEGSAP